MVSDLILAVIIGIPVGIFLMSFFVALGKREGYRRRRQDPEYSGPERRCPYRNACNQGKTCKNRPVDCPLNKPD